MEEKTDEKELAENESYISEDDIDIEVAVSSDEAVVYVKFSNFEDIEDAED